MKESIFYVDSYFANDILETTYSTLAHEFQHMIDWNTKDMSQDLDPSTWYNEMLSMLCEDMMQSYLGIDDDDSPKGRLPTFNQYYRYVGLEYNDTNSSYAVISYATAYAFGAWCARQFGGAELLNAISQNDSVDTDSIIAAIYTISGTKYSIADLLKMYAEACIFNTSDTSYSYPTFNQDAATTLSYSDSTSYTYPMTAIDLWDTAYEWSAAGGTYYNTTSGTYNLGPALFPCTASYSYDLRPYGFTLHEIGTVSSDSVTITFSSTGSSNLDLYIMVQ